MNKRFYKLIFSQSKACLVPVAEYISRVKDHSNKSREVKEKIETPKLSFLSKIISLSLFTFPTYAISSDVVLDNSITQSTKINNTENNVVIIDIAKPDVNSISDNRFEKFNVSNGVVFKNNISEFKSELVGHLEKNDNLNNKTAEAILAQVSGKEKTSLKGGIEIAGNKADLFIVNPNGISINGVKTFNTNRLVATTSNLIDPKNNLALSVDKGEVIIERDGLSTDGLRKVDIVAKKIHQKGAIRGNPNSNEVADIRFIAGGSNVDYKTTVITSKDNHNTENIITGDTLGSMYGKNISFVVTDTGAGVKHQGVILAKEDINITSKDGNVIINDIRSINNISVDSVNTLNNLNRIQGNNVKISSKNLDNNSSIIGNGVSISTNTLLNKGKISGDSIAVDVSKIDNKKGIYANKSLKITTKGNYKPDKNDKNKTENGYRNSGDIVSNGTAFIDFKESNFNSYDHKLPIAKDKVIIHSNKFDISKESDLQFGSDVEIKSYDFENKGIFATSGFLEVNTKYGIYNNGFLGAKNGYVLKSEKTDIINNGDIFSENTSYLGSKGKIVNIGDIYSKGRITFHTTLLKNDAELVGNIKHKHMRYDAEHSTHSATNKYDYKLEANIDEFENSELKTKKFGRIKSDDGVSFIQNFDSDSDEKGIYNYGLINIKGDFENYGTYKILNDSKREERNLTRDYLEKKNKITLRYVPKFKLPFGGTIGLAGETYREFESLDELLQRIFDHTTLLSSGGYYAYSEEVFRDLKNIKSETLQNALLHILGDNWKDKSLDQLRYNWYANKHKNIPVYFYPDRKATILADNLIGDITTIQNGGNSVSGKYKEDVYVGDSKIKNKKIDFKSYFNNPGLNNDFEDSVLNDLLSNTNIFIDTSLQYEKEKEQHNIVMPEESQKELLAKEEKRKAEILAQEEAKRRAELLAKQEEAKRKAELLAKQQEEAKRKAELLAKQQEDELKKAEIFAKQLEEAKQRAQLLAKQNELKEKLLVEQETKRKEELLRKQEEARQQAEILAKQEEEAKKQADLLAKQKEEVKQQEDLLIKQLEDIKQASEYIIRVDPIYRTKIKYINQNDYFGAEYYFNSLKLNENSSVKVIGDNYFEHQFITKNIEKKVGNYLSKKYNLDDSGIVKKLIDNASSVSSSLNLKLGESLSKEQEDNLKEDIVWYVKDNINGNEVFIPRVYLSKDTLSKVSKENNGTSSILSVDKLDVKVEDFNNDSTILAKNISIDANNKIVNSGDILSKENTTLKAKKGIDVNAKIINDANGNTHILHSSIQAGEHIHLETDLDNNVNIDSSYISGKTGFIRTKDLNLNNNYEISHKYSQENIRSKLLNTIIGQKDKETTTVNSVGSTVNFDHLHLAVANDVNQKGSDINAGKLTGIVKGKYNTEAGKNFEHTKINENILSFELSGLASALGFSSQTSVSERDGATHQENNNTDSAVANLNFGFINHSQKESIKKLTHKNSVLNVDQGNLYVLGAADIGGVDINKSKIADTLKQPENVAQNDESTNKQNKSEDNKQNKSEDNAKKLQSLSEAEIANLMEVKDKSFYEQNKTGLEKSNGFTLSADKILSTKEKDQLSYTKETSTIKLGIETEAHSSVVDLITNANNQVRDVQKGLKLDDTAILQQASDVTNLITGDLVGGSVKRTIEVSNSTNKVTENKDARSYLGGNTTLIARNGDITLNNVESNKESNLALIAKNNVSLNAGKVEREENNNASTTRFYDGVTNSCGLLSQGCAVGTISGVDLTKNSEKITETEVQNTLLQGKNVEISAGKDLNLIGANVRANNLHLDVKGKTNIISQQNTLDATSSSLDLSTSIGASVNTQLSVTPTVSFGGGYGYDKETRKQIQQQSGIEAGHITGQINDLNLKGGYLLDNSKSTDFTISGKLTHENIEDHHHKDGGNAGANIGLNERGTGQFNVRGGRSEQIHYESTQQSTLSSSKTDSNINQDIEKANIIHRNDQIAKTKFNFEVLDIIELGQKGIRKSNQTDDITSESPRITDNFSENNTQNRRLSVNDEISLPNIQRDRSTLDSVEINTKSKQDATDSKLESDVKIQKPSLLDRFTQLFKGNKNELPKSKESDSNDFNYASVNDKLNLKSLVELEDSRNSNFETNVLKNEKFLDEARESAKKYIPESMIKQMEGKAEFDEILTEGAKKVEKRINDAVTFKPTGEDFERIHKLVEKLPKSSSVVDTTEQANMITEALASTSKTIQRNPELQSKLNEVIDTFLQESKDKSLTVEMIEKLNHGLRQEEGENRLLYKKETLTKENAIFSSPEASRLQLAETIDFINKSKASGVEPSVLAGLVYQRLIAYHPFAEGNGRMTRVIVNKLLLDAGYPTFKKFDGEFETQIIPQTKQGSKSASSSEVVQEFLRILGETKQPSEQSPIAKNNEDLPASKNVITEPSLNNNVENKQPTPITDQVNNKELVETQRSLLQQVKDKFQPLKVGKKIKDVRDSVESFGGEVSFKFAQSKGEVFNEIIKHSETENGACEATCAFWITKQVSDQNLWNELYQDGKKGQLDKKAFEKIKKLQTEFINSGNSATQQFKFTESWLLEQGVKLKEKQVGDFSRKDEVTGTVTNTNVDALAKAILDTGTDGSGVKKISINLKGGSHTIATSVKGEKVTFFDPNFGEISFNSREQFEKWFKNAFWKKSGYAGTDPNKRFFNVVNYHSN